jgi:hypothetical protein
MKNCENCIWHYDSIICEGYETICSVKNTLVLKNDCCDRFVEEKK